MSLSFGPVQHPVCISPRQMSHSSGISSTLGSPLHPKLHLHGFTQRALRAFLLGTHCLTSVALWHHRKSIHAPHSCNLHTSQTSTMWMALPSLIANLGCFLTAWDHICSRLYILFRSRKPFRPMAFINWNFKLGRVLVRGHLFCFVFFQCTFSHA